MLSTQKPFWSLSADETLASLQSSRRGLSAQSAAARLATFHRNEIVYGHRLGNIAIVANQLKSLLIVLLLVAGAMTVALGEWIEAWVIFAAIFINTLLGYWQENKAENALALLRSYIRTRARVIRDGADHDIDATELVPGDVIRISQGDRIPADARLLYANNLEVDESILTGESLPTAKSAEGVAGTAPISERASMVYSGTLAAQGMADAVVTATDNQTEFGAIAALVARRDREMTPLQLAIHRFSIKFGIVLAILAGALFAVGAGLRYDVFEMFLISVAVAVAAVPEGLPIALTVILAIGVQRLAARKGIVRKLVAAETMGSVSLILTDKTGTLTQANMQVADIIPFDGTEESHKKALIRLAVLNTNVIIENPDDTPKDWNIVGRPLETALVREAAAYGVILPRVLEEAAVIDRLPFDSAHKLSAAFIRDESPMVVLFGAPEKLIEASTLTTVERAQLLAVVEAHARDGERVLAVAKKSDQRHDLKQRTFHGFTFAGLITFRDPLRPSVRDAIQRIGQAGVKTFIVTGDHQGTADAVARELGLATVYARVTPEQKVAIVQKYQQQGEIVAVTGDGVNDAPALKAADIGIAVGSGTDVAKSVADLVILDDNFETIVAAIEEGRRIVDNIRKAMVYLFSNVFDGLFLIGGSLLLGLALPLNALQILFVNFFVDSFPAVAFAFERGIDGIGPRPRSLREGLFDPTMKFMTLIIGGLTSVLLFGLYALLLKFGFDEMLVRTFIFGSFATYTLFLAFAVRSLDKSILAYNPFSNWYLTGGVALGVAATLAVIYTPFFQSIFNTVPLPPVWLAGVLGVGVVNIAAIEVGKRLLRLLK